MVGEEGSEVTGCEASQPFTGVKRLAGIRHVRGNIDLTADGVRAEGCFSHRVRANETVWSFAIVMVLCRNPWKSDILER